MTNNVYLRGEKLNKAVAELVMKGRDTDNQSIANRDFAGNIADAFAVLEQVNLPYRLGKTDDFMKTLDNPYGEKFLCSFTAPGVGIGKFVCAYGATQAEAICRAALKLATREGA